MPEGVWTGADLRKAPKEKQDARIIVTTLLTSYLLSLASKRARVPKRLLRDSFCTCMKKLFGGSPDCAAVQLIGCAALEVIT